MNKTKCRWVRRGIHQRYHGVEWGVSLHDDRNLFEFLLLDGAQTDYRGRQYYTGDLAYRKAFERFSPDKISLHTKSNVDSILKDPGIIRNQKKVESFVNNAKRFLEVKDEFGMFDEYVWQFVNYKTTVNRYRNWNEVPSTSKESEETSRDLKKRWFTFVGPTTCYAFMQSVGMFNDHVVTCFRHKELHGV